MTMLTMMAVIFCQLRGTSSRGLVIPNELLPGAYWVSWKNGQVAFGTGQIPGNGTFVMINVQTEQQMMNISISALNGSFAVPFPYYISNKGRFLCLCFPALAFCT